MRDNVALSLNRLALESVRRTRMGPPMVARALHVLHAAMYDAWAAHDDLAFGTRLGDVLRRPAAAGPRRPSGRRPASPPIGPCPTCSRPRRPPSPRR
jgi:hypothetical protein